MAHPGRQAGMGLKPLLSRHNFFQQVRLMLRWLSPRPHGKRLSVLMERVQFVSPLSLDAPDVEIGEVTETKDGLWQVEVLTHGMVGALGALPTPYTEWMIARYYRYGDITGKAFTDIFTHRLQALRYQAWLKYHYSALYEVSEKRPLSAALCALSGVMQSAPALQRESLVGLFAHPVRSLLNLERWLESLFAVTAKVIPFTGGWREMPRSECCCLGQSAQTLGQAPMLGSLYMDMAAGFTVQLGPVSMQRAPLFLPGGQHYSALWQRIHEYVGPGLEVDIDLLTEHRPGHATPLGMGRPGLALCLGQPTAGVHRIRLPAHHREDK